jgi:hypothetical protein
MTKELRVPAALCRSADLNNQLEYGELYANPEQDPQDNRRKQRAEQAAFQFRRLALLVQGENRICENREKISHDTCLLGLLRSYRIQLMKSDIK